MAAREFVSAHWDLRLAILAVDFNKKGQEHQVTRHNEEVSRRRAYHVHDESLECLRFGGLKKIGISKSHFRRQSKVFGQFLLRYAKGRQAHVL